MGVEEWNSGNITLYCGDALEILPTIPKGSIDLICTDPPYPKKFEYLYTELAKNAKDILRVGGSLITLCGHYQLHRILPAMSEYLKYRWIIKLDQPGSHARMLMGILVTWKPMLWFVNEKLSPRRNIEDCAVSDKRTKNDHPWEQSLGYALWSINSLTDPEQIILDPFMGVGATGIACVKTNRKFIGIEIDEKYFNIAKDRIQEEQSKISILE